MLVLVLRRLLLSVITLVIVAFVVFAITELLPGDAATAYLGREATPERLAKFRSDAGLNRPMPVRFLIWSGKLLKGDLGISIGRRKPVSELLRVRFRNTFLISALAALIGIPVAIGLGIMAALTRNRAVDLVLSTIAICGMSVPKFVVAILLSYIFSIELHILPSITVSAADAPITELVPSMILPIFTLVLTMLAPIVAMVRTRMIEVMTSDFVQMAIFRGVPYSRVVWRHALPNAMLPTIHVLALTTSSILGGLVIIETIFNYPGLGNLTITAIHDRDVPLVQGIAMLSATIYILINVAADLLTLAGNPKLRTLRT